jgi:hypothetical protein
MEPAFSDMNFIAFDLINQSMFTINAESAVFWIQLLQVFQS